MKSKRAAEFINGHIEIGSLQFTVADIEYCAMLAEQDAEGEITRYRTELEESKKREELARKVIDDQREEMEKLKERAVWAFCTTCRHNHKGECRAFVVGYRDDILHESCANVLSWENGHLFCESGYHKFIQKLNEK